MKNNISKQISVILSVLFFVIAAVSALPAFSAPKYGDATLQILRQEIQTKNVSIAGQLICKMSESNDGSACNLKIRDLKTGKTYTISETNEFQNVMRMYQNGVTQVQINGTYRDTQTIQVASVKAL